MSAVLPAAVVTVQPSLLVGSVSGKLYARKDNLKITLAAQGATAGDITAALLGFAEIFECRCYRFDPNSGGGVRALTLGTDGTNIYTFAADDGATAPANFTGDLYLVVEGRSL